MRTKIKISDLTVVVVDDHAVMREMVKTILSAFGFKQIRTYESGIFIDSPLDVPFGDLVICDYQMDPIDGVKILRFLRDHSDPVVSAIPFILMSADSNAEAIAEPYFFGPTEFISKPFTPEILISRIQMVMGGSERFLVPDFEDSDQRNLAMDISDQLAAGVPIIGSGQLFSDQMIEQLLDSARDAIKKMAQSYDDSLLDTLQQIDSELEWADQFELTPEGFRNIILRSNEIRSAVLMMNKLAASDLVQQLSQVLEEAQNSDSLLGGDSTDFIKSLKRLVALIIAAI